MLVFTVFIGRNSIPSKLSFISEYPMSIYMLAVTVIMPCQLVLSLCVSVCVCVFVKLYLEHCAHG